MRHPIVVTVLLCAALAVPTKAHAQLEQADLVIQKSVSSAFAEVGDALRYTLDVGNDGPDTALGVVVADVLPAGVTFLGASEQCSYLDFAHSVECNLDELAAGEGAQFFIDAEITGFLGEAPPETVIVFSFANDGDGPSVPTLYDIAPEAGTPELLSAAGDLEAPQAIAREADDSWLIADNGKVVRVQAGGQQSVLASGAPLSTPRGIAVSNDGRIFVSDSDAGIIEIDPQTGAQTVVSSGGRLEVPAGLAVDSGGQLIVAEELSRVVRVDPDNGAQVLVSSLGELCNPRDVAIDEFGQIYVADLECGVVVVDPASGNNHLLIAAEFDPFVTFATSIVVDSEGTLVIADPENGLLRYLIDGSFLSQLPPGDIEAPEALALGPPPEQNDAAPIINRAELFGEVADPDMGNNSSEARTDPRPNLPVVEVVVAELIEVSDTPAVATALQILVNESIEVTDAPQSRPSLFLTVNETIDVSDAPQQRPSLLLTVNESIEVNDQPTVTPLQPVRITVDERIRVRDLPAVLPAVLVRVNESIEVTDLPVARGAVLVRVDERIQVNDTPLAGIDCNVNGTVDSVDLSRGTSSDCNGNGVPDECDATDVGPDCNANLVPDSCEPDRDGDGFIDDCERCDDDPNKVIEGRCGCGIPEDDRDFDDVPDCADRCPDDPDKTEPGECGCGEPEVDGCGETPPVSPPSNQSPPPRVHHFSVTAIAPGSADVVANANCGNGFNDEMSLRIDWDDGDGSAFVTRAPVSTSHRYRTARARRVTLTCCDGATPARCDQREVDFDSGGARIDCSQLDSACTVGEWDRELRRCVPRPHVAGRACDDGLFCTVDDACEQGSCMGAPRDCARPGAECEVAMCDEARRECTQAPAPDGTACDDGQDCTIADQCEAQRCVGAEPDDDDDGVGACEDCDDADDTRSENCGVSTTLDIRVQLEGIRDAEERTSEVQVLLRNVDGTSPEEVLEPSTLKLGKTEAQLDDVPVGAYFVVVRRVGHLPIRSAAPITVLRGAALMLDLTDAGNIAGGSDAAACDASGCALFAGDADGDNDVDIDDFIALQRSWLSNDAAADFDHDGRVFLEDYSLWKENLGKRATK